MKKQIRGKLEETLKKRIEIEKKHIENMEENLKKAKEKLQKRESKIQEIIDGKLDELTKDPDLKW